MTDRYITGTERWDDLRVAAASLNPTGQAAPPTLNQNNGLLEFAAAATNVIAFQVQMPHAWREGTAVRPHVHWRKKTQGAGNVLWRLNYEFANVGAVYTDTLAEVDSTSTVADTPDDGAALRHLITAFGSASMTGKTVSAVGFFVLSRIGGDVLDTYAGVAQVLSIDLHYQLDSMGSMQEYLKQGCYGIEP